MVRIFLIAIALSPITGWGQVLSFKKKYISKEDLNPYLGAVSDYQRIESESLSYAVRFKVYTPPNYENLDNLATIYFTDGPGYLNEEGGDVANTLDHLIEEARIEPLIAIFIDQRDPYDPSVNRRNSQFFNNDRFVSFIVDELVPYINSHYKSKNTREKRAIMGLSFGGLNAAYFGIKAHGSFAKIGMQSPALHPRPEIYELYQKSEMLPLQIFLTTGDKGDTEVSARQMKKVLEEKGYHFYYKEVPYKHNWLNWRPLIPEALVYFFGLEE